MWSTASSGDYGTVSLEWKFSFSVSIQLLLYHEKLKNVIVKRKSANPLLLFPLPRCLKVNE